MRVFKLFLLFTLILLASFGANAGVVKFSNYLSGRSISGSMVVEDDLLPGLAANGGLNYSGWYYKSVKNIVSLNYLGTDKKYYSAPWSVTVRVKITRWNSSGYHVLPDEVKDLSVNYDPTSGTIDQDQSAFIFQGAFRVKVTVLQVTTNNPFYLPDDLILENNIESDRNKVEFYGNQFNVTSSFTGKENGRSGYVNLYIQPDKRFEEYEIEFAYISVYGSLITNDLFLNANRIVTRGPIVEIPYVVDDKRVLFRVRGKGQLGLSNNTTGSYLSSWSNPVEITQQSGSGNLDNAKSWTYEITYAEDGKFSAVLGFFDGTGKVRQQVSTNNEENTVMVTEQIYDLEGRNAVATIPAPPVYAKDDGKLRDNDGTVQGNVIAGALNKNLKFYNNFSLNSFGFDHFNADDLLNYGVDICETPTANRMHTSNGASNYYSGLNWKKLEGEAKAIPDADGYPYSQTLYTDDGRVARVSSPGEAHSIGTRHETKYTFANPTQTKLDMMFGNHAGAANYYSLTMTEDANGQMALSYTDLTGKVVATSLVGNLQNTDNGIKKVDDNPLNSGFITEDLECYNHYQSSTEKMEVAFDYLITNTDAPYYFEYNLTQEQYNAMCSNSAIGCVYDLKIFILDDCQNVMVSDGEVINPGSINLNQTYVINGAFAGNFTVNFPKIGKYTIVKQLSINQSALQSAVNSFLSDGVKQCPDYKRLEDIKDAYDATIDVTECISCNTIERAQYYGQEGTAGYQQAVQNYNASGVCDVEFENSHPCDNLYKVLLMDMSPNGQYFDNVPEKSSSTYNKNGWLNGGGSGYVTSGTLCSPGQNSLEYCKPNVWNDAGILLCENVSGSGSPTTFNVWNVLKNFTKADGSKITSWQELRDNWKDSYVNSPFEIDLTVAGASAAVNDIINFQGQNPSHPINNFFKLERTGNYLTINGKASLIEFHPEYCSYKACLTSEASRVYDEHLMQMSNLADASYYSIVTYPIGDFNYPGANPPTLPVNTTNTKFYTGNATTFTGQNISNLDPFKVLLPTAYYNEFNAYLADVRTSGMVGATTTDVSSAELSSMSSANNYSLWYHAKYLAQQQYPNASTLQQNDFAWNIFKVRYIARKELLITFWRNSGGFTYQNCGCPYAYDAPPVGYIKDNVADCKTPADFVAGEYVPSGSCALVTSLATCNSTGCTNANIVGFVIRDPELSSPLNAGTLSIDQDLANTLSSHIPQNTDLCEVIVNNDPEGNTVINAHGMLYKSPTDMAAESVYGYRYILAYSPSVTAGSAISGSTVSNFMELYNRKYVKDIDLKQVVAELINTVNNNQNVNQDVKAFPNICKDCACNNTYGFNLQFVNRQDQNGVNYYNNPLCNYQGNNATEIANLSAVNALGYGKLYCYSIPLTYEQYTNDGYNTLASVLSASGPNFSESNCSPPANCNPVTTNNNCTDFGNHNTISNGVYTDNLHFAMADKLEYRCYDRLVKEDHCFCSLVDLLLLNYAAKYDNGDYIVNHATFPTFVSYVTDYLQKEGNDLTINSTEVEIWLANCHTYGTPDGTATPGSVIKASVNCELTSCELEDTPVDENDYYATLAYEKYLKEKKDQFIKEYKEKCFSNYTSWNYIRENFKVTHKDKEYHYTLYYYDLAGNLMRTVPPNGVHLLNAAQVTCAGAYRTGVAANGCTGPQYPQHTMGTEYEFNAQNKVNRLYSPDGGEQKFYYDLLERLVLSQNARQKARSQDLYSSADHVFSYSRYDALNRITEVGQIEAASAVVYANISDDTWLNSWLQDNRKVQVTTTVYDGALAGLPAQDNLRKRVASTYYEDIYDGNPATRQTATHYSYDSHGSVKVLYTENNHVVNSTQRLKITNYRYDLLSGNVLQVSYQENQPDAFYHKYCYDKNNRLTVVYTSTNGIIWNRDSRYNYYLHGPLSRQEIGQKNVQGLDFAYNLNGWLKGVNGAVLNPDLEMGADGVQNNNNNYYTTLPGLHSAFATDAMAYTLSYFSNNQYQDYTPVNTGFMAFNVSVVNPTTNNSNNLFNGNIRQSVMALALPQSLPVYGQTAGGVLPVLVADYVYDQLNRILNVRTRETINPLYLGTAVSNTASGGTMSKYGQDFTYDMNGNIATLKRNSDNLTDNYGMDELEYYYYTTTGSVVKGSDMAAQPAGVTQTNKLAYVKDYATGSLTADIKDMANTDNFAYDETGNLVSDKSEEIANIEWTVYGKIAKITRTAGSAKPDLVFNYDPMGNRIGKIVINKGANAVRVYTDYSRDAQGNILATYKREFYQVGYHTQAAYNVNSSYEGGDYSSFTGGDYSAMWTTPAGYTAPTPYNGSKTIFLSSNPAEGSMFGPGIKIPVLGGDDISLSVKNYFTGNTGDLGGTFVLALTDNNNNFISTTLNSGIVEYHSVTNNTPGVWKLLSLGYTVPASLSGQEVYLNIYPYVAQGNKAGWFDDLRIHFSPATRVDMREDTKIEERNIYGSSLIGVYNTQDLVGRSFYTASSATALDVESGIFAGVSTTTVLHPEDYKMEQGHVIYQLTNHLGNVQITLSDRKLTQGVNTLTEAIQPYGNGGVSTEISDLTTDNDNVSCKVHSGNPYGSYYYNRVEPGDVITVSGYANLNGQSSSGSLVVDVVDLQNNHVFYNAPTLTSLGVSGSGWQPFTYSYTVGSTSTSNLKLAIYPYNTGTNPVWIDGLTVSLNKGNTTSVNKFAYVYKADVLSTTD